MEVVANNAGLKLIKKYERYYIRFVGEQYEECPCDLLSTNKEVMAIVSDNSKIKEIRDEYKKKISWSLFEFIHSVIKNYMFYECNMAEKRSLDKFRKSLPRK